ncbi:MAG: hypothetical protein H6Q68_1362 [Firmicutes bacterium]|nr:hypothetical protein [Bacillota bacterium]
MCWKTFLQRQEDKDDEVFFFRWLAVELAPTIYGEKPGTLLNLMNTSKLCMKTLWLKYGYSLLVNSNIEWIVLKDEPGSMKILFYRIDLLNASINDKNIRHFLEGFGYHKAMTLQEMLYYFKERFQYRCPHEMGIFLGIPLKDVMGFMGMSEDCRTCQGMWHIYGDPISSLDMMQRMEATKSQVADWMMEGHAVTDVLCGTCLQIA